MSTRKFLKDARIGKSIDALKGDSFVPAPESMLQKKPNDFPPYAVLQVDGKEEDPPVYNSRSQESAPTRERIMSML